MNKKSKLQSILEADFDGVRSYSGLGMYGRSCLAIDCDRGVSLGDVFSVVLTAVEGEDDTSDLQEAFQCMRSDAMGLGTIYYFPNVPYVEEDEEDEDHDCEGPECCTPA